MVVNTLNQMIDKLSQELSQLQWKDKNQYAQWLAQTYFYVRHTSEFLKLCEPILREKGLSDALAHNLSHQREEAGHEKLLLNDLKTLGFNIEDFKELPSIQVLYNYQYYWLKRHKSVAAHNAYALLFEGTAAQSGRILSDIVAAHYGKKAATFIEVHAGLDGEHFAEGLSALNSLPPKEAEQFRDSLLVTTRLYIETLKIIKGQAVETPPEQVGKIIERLKRNPETVARIPEESDITDNFESVSEYQLVGTTNMMANYCVTMDLAHRLVNKPGQCDIVDFASGPGILAKLYVEQKIAKSVTGYDLSTRMVSAANSQPRPPQVVFKTGDVRNLLIGKTADVVTFNNSSHHLDTIHDVSLALRSAERTCKDDGVILMTDLARLPNRECIGAFSLFAGSEFIRNKMFWMFEDFKRSLMAAWSPSEILSAVPTDSKRAWYHLVLPDLPFYQALIGLPKSRSKVFLRDSRPWEQSGLLVSPEAMGGYFLMKDLMSRSSAVPLRSTSPEKKAA